MPKFQLVSYHKSVAMQKKHEANLSNLNDSHLLLARVNRLELELRARECDIAVLQQSLSDVRRRPMANLGAKLVHALLSGVARHVTIIPESARSRFLKSAEKRDPLRNDLAPKNKIHAPMKYERVIEEWEKLRLLKESEKLSVFESFSKMPLISIVVPVYNPEPVLLAEMIESVLKQSYPDWELCIADDCSTNAAVRETLEKYAQKDSRIRIAFREENGHICHASNTALELASGEFVGLLDHDDLLDRDALFYVVQEINKTPNARIIYSDEDKVTIDGHRYDPCFKPDWSKELLLSNNYVSHFGVYKKSLIEQIGGFRAGFEGAQDYDLILRASLHCSPQDIRHVPKVLYSWRASPGSTALSASTKNYTHEAGLRALQSYLIEAGEVDAAVVSGEHPNMYKINWNVGVTPLVSLIMPTRDHLGVTRVAVESILSKTSYKNFELIIVDNGSSEPETTQWFRDVQSYDSRVKVIRDDAPFNYSALNNRAVRNAAGFLIGLVNNDVEVISEDWLSEMVSLAVRPDVGCVGAKLYYPNDTIQHAGVIVGMGGVAAHVFSSASRNAVGYFGRLCCRQEYTAVTAACLVVRREVYQEVGGLNEENLAVAFNDVDFCLKVHSKGYRNIWTPYAELYHYESISRGSENTPEKKFRFDQEKNYMKETWRTHEFKDPAFNINLSLRRRDFALGEPTWS